jgi:serine/threonine protein kinase
VDLKPFPTLVRFGVFELDLRARELRKDGLSTGLPEQSIKILALLLENPGEIVLRDEIRKKLWPNDTVVEFDHGINAAIKRLRQSLGDPAEAPQYIETLARRGYRWKFPVELVEAQPQAAALAEGERVQSGTAAGGNLIGKKVSHYRVLELLGGGGMGVVFKAEDLKLGRRVALKFLPQETANDPLTLQRFEQEARAASALNHPNICTIYEIAEHERQPFIVMELLEGETLRELISAANTKTAPLPLKTLLDLSIQITEGLDTAHQKGIIHRDIKPANVFVTTQGQAKILDFGLAKLDPVLAAAEAYSGREHGTDDVHGDQGDTAREPASDLLLSRTGVAMGTAGYMSPEQVRGERLDARTDLFSFGLVVYEMATGQRPFTGETAPILHNAILNRTPTPARELNSELPLKLEQIIQKALEKDREVRYQSASEIRTDLESLKLDLEPRPSVTHWREMTAAVVAVLLIASAFVWFAKHQPSYFHAVPDLKLRQLTTNSTDNRVTSGTISPDGKYLAYTDRKGLYVKLIETGDTRAVPKPESFKTGDVEWETGPWFPGSTRFLADAHPPGQASDDWSSEGTSIWMVSVIGEAPRKLRDKAVAYSVSPDGSSISFGTNKGKLGDREIWLMGSDGEQARKLYDTDENSSIFWFNWSPDGQRVMYAIHDESGDTLVSRDPKGGPLTTLLPPSEMKKVRDLSWLPDGRLLYSMDEPEAIRNTCDFWVMRIDTRTGEVIEKARRLTNWSGFSMATVSVTADGKRLAFLGWEGHGTSYMADLAVGGTQILRPLRFPWSESSDAALDWTPDSKAIILMSNRTGRPGIYKQSLEEDTAEPLVTDGASRDAHVTPDGKWVLYFGKTEAPRASGPEPVMRVSITGGPSQFLFTGKRRALIVCARSSNLCAIAEPTDDHKQVTISTLDPLRGRGPELARFNLGSIEDQWWFDLSPDGTRVAATPSPAEPIYILSLRGQATQQIQVRGWSNLMSLSWAADGKSLFVVSGNRLQERALLHVDLQGNAHLLWKNPGASAETTAVASPDGRHLAMSDWTVNSNLWMMENF